VGEKKKKKDVIGAEDRQSIDRFLDALWLESGLSDHTVSAYRRDIEGFCRFLVNKRRNTDHRQACLASAKRAQVLEYLAEKVADGASSRTTARLLSALRRFYRFELRDKRVDSDPTVDIDSPRLGRHLPTSMSEVQVEKLLESPDLSQPLGMRDRAMLELLYATGLRVTELISLELSRLDLQSGVVRVIGKGGKERLVPFGEEATHYLNQ